MKILNILTAFVFIIIVYFSLNFIKIEEKGVPQTFEIVRSFVKEEIKKIEIEQGDVLLIKYKTNSFGDLTCNNQNIKYIKDIDSIKFFVSSQYGLLKKIQCFLNDEEIYNISVKKKEFVNIFLNYPEKYIAYNKEELEQIAKDRKALKKAYENSKSEFNFDGFVDIPYKRITSFYGETRTNQNNDVSYHNGIDYGLKTGEKIISIGDGKIVLARELYFCGNTVIIDHGLDIFSIYCHLDSISVSEEDSIKKSETIGTAGNSGLSTNTHLHFALKINNLWADPDSFLSKVLEKE